MALSLVGVGAAVHGTTTVTPTVPAGYTATNGDFVFVVLNSKRATVIPNTPAGWTEYVSASVGTGTPAGGAGPVRMSIFYRTVSGGSLTIPAFTQDAGVAGTAAMTGVVAIYRADNGIIADGLDWAGSSDTASNTSLSSVPWAGGISVTGGDQILVHATVTGTTPRFQSISTSASGATLGTFTERVDVSTTNGDDIGTGVYTGSCTSGSADFSAAFTLSSSTGSTGGVIVVRVRETTAPVVTAPADSTITVGDTYTQTATGTYSPTSWAWTVQSGPAEVGNTISTAAAISWTPGTAGTYVLRATATNGAGSGYDEVTVTVDPPLGPGTYTRPVVRSATSDFVTTTSESVICAKPAGLAVGDLLLACHTADADGDLANMTAPAGFVLQGSQAGHATNNYPFVKIWTKIATSGDVAASTFTFPGDADSDEAGALVAIQAGTFNPNNPIGPITFTTQARTSNQAITAPSITGDADALLICVLAADTNNTTQSFSTPPTGMTEVADAGQSYSLIGVFSEALAADGATGTRTATPSPSSTTNGWTSASFLVNPSFTPSTDTNYGRMFAFLA